MRGKADAWGPAVGQRGGRGRRAGRPGARRAALSGPGEEERHGGRKLGRGEKLGWLGHLGQQATKPSSAGFSFLFPFFLNFPKPF